MPGRDFLPRASDVRELTVLALPIITVQVGLMLMGVADMVMVGHYAPEALAAVAMGNIYLFSAFILGQGILLAVDPLVAQAVGADDRAGIANAVQRGIVLAALLTPPVTLLSLPVAPVLAALGQPAEVVPVAAAFVRGTLPGIFPMLLFGVLRSTLQAVGRVRAVVVVIVLANLLNVLLNWILIYGRLGAPALGATGAGIATGLSRFVLGLGVLALGWPALRPLLRPWRREAFDAHALWNTTRVGLAIGLTMELEYGAFGATGLLVGTLGTSELAGHQIALNLASLTFMVPLAIGSAAAVVVGRAVGAGDPAGMRRGAGASLLVGIAVMVASATLFLVAPVSLARLYADDAAVIALAASVLPLAGLFQVFDGIQAVAVGILRGAGDTRVPLVMNVLGFWLIGLPVSWAGAKWLGLGVVGAWWGFVVGLAGVAALLAWRVRTRLRRRVERLTVERPAVPIAAE
ncbi:MAG: MATE family efflux transporter [Gemmatimonadales bacterium]|nr:MATE family efflux transporter [Gemmatimonadales bacterium]